MSPLSAPVLGGAALISSPALWGAFIGTTTTETALLRYLVCAALCWLGLAVVTTLVGPPPRVHTDEVLDPEPGTASRSGEDVAA